MKYYAPAGYQDFRCRADRCAHTCCAGWEIDIDPDTRALYAALAESEATPPELRRLLQERIGGSEEEGWHFILDEKERCPFLDDRDLCRLISRFGDGILCQICRDHPRFRNFFSDREEIGLGLCCEEAAAALTEGIGRFTVELLEDDGDEEEPLDELETGLLAARDALLDILQAEDVPFPERIRQALAGLELTVQPDAAAFRSMLLTETEVLEPEWLRILREPPAAREFTAAEARFACCLLYRHLPGLRDDGRLQGRVLFALCGALLMNQTPCAYAEFVRRFSAELEYSDANLDLLFERLDAWQ